LTCVDPVEPDVTVLDDPVGASLRGHHAHLARRRGDALTYRPTVATFSAMPLAAGAGDWRDLADLLGPGAFADLFSSPVTPPADWEPVFTLPALQMVGDPSRWEGTGSGSGIVELGESDVPDMLDLAADTRPGPFWAETYRLGRYVGIREDGRLVAMAGERLHPPGWTEISAVCTRPEARGRGLAARLILDLAAGIAERGERPFLHVVTENTSALRLYRHLGFEVRREVRFHGYLTPTA
jgi:ribosomal protein S18 acetylase RimI-like enzyme